MSYFYPLKRKNKYEWEYRFLYWNQDRPEVYDYSIVTREGFQVAESAAWGNCTFDGCNQLKYLGKTMALPKLMRNMREKMEVENGTNA